MTGNYSKGNCRCGYFQGKTGRTVNHPTSGWTSFLGAVIYDPDAKTAYIAFRGSRSGNASRAAKSAQIFSEGNPDWVTDMNHLKEAVPYKPDFGPQDLKLAAGFWLSYASAHKSMEAALKYAVHGGAVDTVCVTGHSLGGALAQCAYIHLCTSPRIKERLQLRPDVFIECYPISAPPVCMDVTSQHWISRSANADNVHHYYCPYDAVHACDLVLGGWETKLAAVVGMRHPRTTPYHFGSQLALDTTVAFPDAHEPFIIWKALWGGQQRPPGFWQEIELDLLRSSVKSTSNEDQVQKSDIQKAIVDSYSAEDFIDRARHWASGISKAGNKAPADRCIDEVARLYSTENYQDRAKYNKNAEARSNLIRFINQSKNNNTSDTAGCVYHTLLVSIGLQRLIGNIDWAP